MEFYLIRHGHVDEQHVADRQAAGLTAEGRAQAECLGEQCRVCGVLFLCVSTVARAQQTADIIESQLPDALRWDLQEIEEMHLDDLFGLSIAGPLISTWTKEQLTVGYERTWVRVMAALARIQIYAEAHGIERVAIVAHQSTIHLLLLNWLGMDWRAIDRLRVCIDEGSSSKITLGAEGSVTIDWLNRL